jgi:enamine deaminase RidA (YjgF/YER057c/UK114 family)
MRKKTRKSNKKPKAHKLYSQAAKKNNFVGYGGESGTLG